MESVTMEGLAKPGLNVRPASRPISAYAALAGLLTIAAGYQVLVARDIFRGMFHSGSVYEQPFDVSVGKVDDPGAGAAVGLRKGDSLLAVEGVPYTGAHLLDQALAGPQPGRKLTVTVRSPNGGDTRTLQIPLTTFQAGGDNTRSSLVLRSVIYLLMPWFCLVLGFWVAAVRPRDRLAWLLLALMLSFSQILGTPTGAWGPGIRDVARFYHLLAGNLWGIAMLLFGLYFPEPFPNGGRGIWKWVKWGLIAVLAVSALPEVIVKTVDMEAFSAVEWLRPIEGPFEIANSMLNFLAVSIFFAAIFMKGSMAVSSDAKRRLRLLYAGSAISLIPVCVVVVFSMAKGAGGEIGKVIPGWLLFTVLVLLFLFPLTLAYTIVVQRAMDVSVVIRQGLQYALARSGVKVLQFVLMVAVVLAATFLASDPRIRLPQKLEAVALGMAAVLWTKRGADWLRGWTDRRFFRDAYNAEQILSELGDKVRTIVEVQPLLATVSHRIAESLHVPRVAALIDGSGPYRPAYALGYPETPKVIFPENAATIRQLVEAGEPARVYVDDPDSWLYRRQDLTEEERRQLEQLGAELLLPLPAKDHLLGFISLGPKRSEAPYTASDLRLLKSVAVQTGFALENTRLTAAVAREAAQREKLNREVEIAREVQQRLFPQKLPPIPGLDYSGACRPALGVGGDYYDFLALPGGRLGVAVGDVSGKGIAAALMMATLQASLRGEAMRGSENLGRMIAGVNRLVFDASTANRYATFFYAEYDSERRELSYVNAGHNPPMLFRAGGDGAGVERLDVGGTVIGLMESFPFHQATVTLDRGDMLVAYTDGVSEAMNPEDEEWGEERMMQVLERCRGLNAARTIEYVMAGADAFASGAPQHDDMTLAVLNVI
ncbi:MAG TPA: SpoIIE family protein phosphatase [Terriglobia bacterium]|nr:SpoIIE family protein phosphatase [Terriglobia bacterium]